MEHLENSLSGITLPGHKTFREYLLEHGKMSDFSYSLEQFEHELRTYSLRKDDANIVIGFLTELANSLRAKELTVKSYGEGSDHFTNLPFVSFKGEEFLNASVEFDLMFMNPGSCCLTYQSRSSSDSLRIDLEEYKGRDEYISLERALEKIRSDNEGDLENRELKKLQEEGCVWFEAKTDSLLNLNLGIMLRKIISATKAVESSYQATKQMKKLYNERINNLTEKMLTPHLS